MRLYALLFAYTACLVAVMGCNNDSQKQQDAEAIRANTRTSVTRCLGLGGIPVTGVDFEGYSVFYRCDFKPEGYR